MTEPGGVVFTEAVVPVEVPLAIVSHWPNLRMTKVKELGVVQSSVSQETASGD